jgi:hypothetical protein
MSNDEPVTDNIAESRYEIHVGDDVAVLTYRDNADGARVFVHTGVPPALERHGVGSRLVKAALDDAKRIGRHVVPQCPFVASYIKRHPEYQSLLAAGR